MIDVSRIKNAIARSKDRISRHQTMIKKKPRLQRFSEFLIRDEKLLVSSCLKSVRMPDRNLPEQLHQDQDINYIHSTIPFDGNDFEKLQAVEDISTTLAEYVGIGTVLIFAICVSPD